MADCWMFPPLYRHYIAGKLRYSLAWPGSWDRRRGDEHLGVGAGRDETMWVSYNGPSPAIRLLSSRSPPGLDAI